MPTELERLAGRDGGGIEPRKGEPSGRYDVLPYDALKDSLGEVFLTGLWSRMKRDGTFEVFFHDAPGMNFAQFVREFSIEGHNFIGMLVKRDAKGEVTDHVGVVGVGQVILHERLKRGVGSFLFFREYWNKQDTDGAAKAALRYVFDDNKLDVLAGVTPARNRAALAFIHRLGFESIGALPKFVLYNGEPDDAVLSYLTADRWRARHG